MRLGGLEPFVGTDAPWTHAEVIATLVGRIAAPHCHLQIPVFTLKDRDYVELGRRIVLGKQQIEFIALNMPFVGVCKLREFVA